MVKSRFKDLKKSMQNEGGSDVLVNGHPGENGREASWTNRLGN